MRFEQAENTPPVAGGLSACITRAMLDRFGVNVAAFPELAKVQGETCVPLTTAIPGSETAFNFASQRLDVSLPQVALQTAPGATFRPNSGMKAFPPRW